MSKDINYVEVSDYNELFRDLQELCDSKNVCNLFRYINLYELEELNHLLDRLLLFVENINADELEDFECGNDVFKLYQLADMLFARDLN